eukprot:CAMPEP_0172609620 /NCGR_PEP_ID=MMETSP1068-20121228/29588_1 /TAXON_ID=35684 /ORGANISM="Pseudopedinella elastica, Strain CCMP716" /LENGTH=330 /DNA_ID=CAMNT_0013413179 /DNA_START=74 /DNA_END=1066 /DNA_ORIENTATION=-
MYSHTDVIDDPISLSDEIWSYFSISESDEPYVEPDHTPLDGLERSDGTPFDDDDERALLPYAAFLPIVNLLSGLEDDDEDDDCDEQPSIKQAEAPRLFQSVTRADGTPLTDEDEAALLEFGAFASLFTKLCDPRATLGALAGSFDLPLVGAEDEPPTGSCEASPSSFQDKPLFPFHVARRDGREIDADDEAALLELAPAVYLGKVFEYVFGEAPLVGELGAFAEADEDLTRVGEHLCATFVGGVRGDSNITANASDAASFWFDMDVGNMLLGIFKRTFGSLSDPSSFMTTKLGTKRKMSGAELSAWIGLTTQSSLGLDDPKRKVRARAVM